MSAYELIIFDNDGVLVDSELIYKSANQDALVEAGFPLNIHWLYEHTAGLNWQGACNKLQEVFGRMPSDDVSRKLYADIEKRLQDLKAIEGAEKVLQSLPLRFCVGTNGNFNLARKKLQIAGLDPYFKDEHLFSAHHEKVQKAKPAPDLFLFAAQSMGVHPSKCLVVEDSPIGVEAAKSAGMAAVGFIGGSHSLYIKDYEEKLRVAGASDVIENLIEILNIVN